ncbi:hypothetical protein FB451DRAFT_671914 [Mycena latifolia]|nr:hypothetical protein FB451DRAFT_671914 [Mycena latifolia]
MARVTTDPARSWFFAWPQECVGQECLGLKYRPSVCAGRYAGALRSTLVALHPTEGVIRVSLARAVIAASQVGVSQARIPSRPSYNTDRIYSSGCAFKFGRSIPPCYCTHPSPRRYSAPQRSRTSQHCAGGCHRDFRGHVLRSSSASVPRPLILAISCFSRRGTRQRSRCVSLLRSARVLDNAMVVGGMLSGPSPTSSSLG